MAAIWLIMFTIITTICFCSPINAAVIHNVIYAEELVNPNEIGDPAEGHISFPSYDSVRPRRSRELEGQAGGQRLCYNMPCGWAVYTQFIRKVDYYFANLCSCPASYRCVEVEDDFRIPAYVYKCRINTNAADIEWPNYGTD